MSIDISRHKELFNPSEFHYPINVIGAGATGSWLTLCLAKLGLENIKVWDFDVVEEHNIANQAYRIISVEHETYNETDIGHLKTNALLDVIRQFSGSMITARNIKVTGEQRMEGIVFMLTDTMSSRKEIWEQAIKFNAGVKLLIETRMGLNEGRIYTINPTNFNEVKRYEQTFYNDTETVVSACGASQSVITTAMSIAAQAVRQMINWHNNAAIHQEVMFDYINNQTMNIKFN